MAPNRRSRDRSAWSISSSSSRTLSVCSPSAGGGAMPASRGARGTMQPSDHPAYSTPAMAPAPAPAAPGNAFDDDNPFADDSVTGAM